MNIRRIFQDIPEGRLNESDQDSFLVKLGWSGSHSWQQLLLSKRILIVSAAGAGKTYECRLQRQLLWDAGAPAFFLELATLAKSDVRSMLDEEEERRLDSWLASQSEEATFFLDSVDELKLSLGSFEQALKCLRKTIAGQLGRARIVITTRPIPFDEKVVRRVLPVPDRVKFDVSGDAFARVAVYGQSSRKNESGSDSSPDWRTVVLMPLSDVQISEFASGQGINDASLLMEDLRRRNALEFARRPQDLIELCADWRAYKRIRSHRDQVATNVRIKLNPRLDRPEPAELSVAKAVNGASRLALALVVMRRLTIRHSAEADVGGDDTALDPGRILSDWNPAEIKALLERGLFEFASYGRVRFHHRSVVEYLAAQRIRELRGQGMSARSMQRLIFAKTKGKTIVRPSMRPVAGWLALSDDRIFEMLRDCEPAVLLAEGDPESLTLDQRKQALLEYVKRFGKGGWRGLVVPHIQVHRFAAPELATVINQAWAAGIENHEIREILINLIGEGGIEECSDIVYSTALNTEVSSHERLAAVDALVTLQDARLNLVTKDALDNPVNWSDSMLNSLVLRLFPEQLSVEDYCRVVARIKGIGRRFGDVGWQLRQQLLDADLAAASLESLRDGLSLLVSKGLRWQKEWPHIVSDRSDLAILLAAVCARGLKVSPTKEWLRASVLAFRTRSGDAVVTDEAMKELSEVIAGISADQNSQLFWLENGFIQTINPSIDIRERHAQVIVRGLVRLDRGRDLDWIKAALAEVSRAPTERALLLEAAMRLAPSQEERLDHIRGLTPLVGDLSELAARIEERLNALSNDAEKWEEVAYEKKRREEKEVEKLASWEDFWRKVIEHPEEAFSSEQSGGTAWNLWSAMEKSLKEGRKSGWNRDFINAYFGQETADRLRRTLMCQWRKHCPTLVSERAVDSKNTYLMVWELGLAGIYAEAEDPLWATKLSHEEAKLAARYAVVELNGLPNWIESLTAAHPQAVDEVLGQELSLQLREIGGDGHSMILQDISHAADTVVACFLPRLESWLAGNDVYSGKKENVNGAAFRLQQVISILKKYGDARIRQHLCTVARSRLQSNTPKAFELIWLRLLIGYDPSSGVDKLEERTNTIKPAKRSDAVLWIRSLFGDRDEGVNLSEPAFTPQILLRLLRLAYYHVRRSDDANHEGSYSPDDRDDAESARNAIVNALLNAKGEEGWAAKLEMAADPLFAFFKDRIVAIAEERWAGELDAHPFNEMQAIALDNSWEAPPSTNEGMFAIMTDRLEDLDDILLLDSSPREAWAGVTEERVMRRVVARELEILANGLYKVDQEAVTADEKETDIRLRSTASDCEGVIELKLADGRSARDLRDTIHKQIVVKYMASNTCRAGCLLITLAEDRNWEHPVTGQLLDFDGLIGILHQEAQSIVERLGGSLRLHVHALDLRPRLSSEKGTGKSTGA